MFGINKYFYERKLRKFLNKIELWLDISGGDELGELITDYYLRNFPDSYCGLAMVLSEIEERYGVFSSYFGKHNYLLTPEIELFSGDELPDGEWLSVCRNERVYYKEYYKVPFFKKKFGFDVNDGVYGSLTAFENFIFSLYVEEYKLEFNKVSYIVVEDRFGKRYRICRSLSEIEYDLLKSGYSLLRSDEKELIYVRI
jgi:hypothetical protein